VIGAWAVLWLVVAGLIAYRSRCGDRVRAASWLIAIAAFVAALEDPALLIWLASISAGAADRDGVVGLVHAHVRGHMYGGGVFSLAGLALAVTIALIPLRRRERWAWWALTGMLMALASVDIAEVLFVYPHGFPIGVQPADGHRGFGWPAFASYIAIWAFGLVYCRKSVFSPHRR
jgi:hypothetical protein